MSKPLRIALVVEGATDEVVLRAAIEAIVGDRPIQFSLLQPEFSDAFGGTVAGQTGTGWGGVYRWCEQTRDEGNGRVSGSVLFGFHELLIVHLDADVAGKKYRDHNIVEPTDDLPCEHPCPPAVDTTNALRKVLLRWMGETSTPEWCVLCTPSKNTETWIMAAFFPRDRVISRKGWECYDNPQRRLTSKPLKVRIKKTKSDYQQRADELKSSWPNVRMKLTEAGRFSDELSLRLAAVEAK